MRILRLWAPVLLIAGGFVLFVASVFFGALDPYVTPQELVAVWGGSWALGFVFVLLDFKEGPQSSSSRGTVGHKTPGKFLAIASIVVLAYGYVPFALLVTTPRPGPQGCQGAEPCSIVQGTLVALWPGLTILLDLLVMIPLGLLVLAVAVDRHLNASRSEI